MKQLLKEWAPVIAVCIAGTTLLLNQSQSFGRLEASVAATREAVAVLRADMQYDLSDVRERVRTLEEAKQAARLAPTGILWRDANADTNHTQASNKGGSKHRSKPTNQTRGESNGTDGR